MFYSTRGSYKSLISLALSIIFSGLFLPGCSLIPISESEAAKLTEIRETELDVNVKQTLLAQQQTDRETQLTVLSGTASAQALSPAPTSTEPQHQTPDIVEPPATPTSVAPAPTAAPPPFNEDAFREWNQSAKILLYEDMTAKLDTIRYVKLTLDKMGLKYKDDGSAYGWLLEDLQDGPQPSGQWDLIIIAAEDKKGVQGDFFSGLLNAIDKGTSVIFELWYLDGTYKTNATGMLSRCGIGFENDWVRIQPSHAALFNLSPDNPILSQPNKNLSFSATTSYWWDPKGFIDYDIGDLIKVTPGTQATLLLGTQKNSTTSHGTAVVCMDGKLILQTFSSHVLKFDTMSPLWENYIYNALRTRYSALNQ